MSRSRFLLATSLAGALSLSWAAAGCGDDPASCGPGSIASPGVSATGGSITLSFGQFTSGINNDCPSPGTPAGLISVTVFGTQTNGTGMLTLCVSRPDLLAGQPQPLVEDVPGSAGVLVVDIDGTLDGCEFSIDTDQPISGTATTQGLCGNGTDPAGFALEVHGALTLTRTCGTTVDTLAIQLDGRVPVMPR